MDVSREQPAYFSAFGEPEPYDATVGEISFVRRRAPNPDWAVHGLTNRRYEVLGFADSGRADYECRGQRFKVAKGNMLFFPRATPHSGSSDPSAPWSFYSAAFALEAIGRTTMHAFTLLPNCVAARNPLEVRSLFGELERLWDAREPGYLLRCRGILLQLLHVYIRTAAQRAVGVPHLQRLMPVVRQLQEDHQRTYSVEELAEQAGLSPSRFRVLFKQLTGHPVTRYHNWLRINKAKDLLLSGEYTVAAAAKQVGFDDVYYFSRLFKKLTGFSPSYYRNR